MRLRQALEGTDDGAQSTNEDAAIVMKGPLAEVYTQALDVAYAKEPDAEPAPPPTEEQVAAVTTALESQQMDAQLMQNVAKLMSPRDGAVPEPVQTVFSVSKDGVTDDVLVDLTSELANPPTGNDLTYFVLIVDATVPSANSETAGAPVERMEMLGAAMECMVTAHGGKVFHSLGDFMKSREKKKK